MKSLKKIISIFVTLNLTIIALWSMPGFKSYLPDNSGEFVYYEDTTFHRKSYIGILYYDESTIQVRYYAPSDAKQKLPENEISILLSIDPEANYWKMTGERILSTITPNTDDVSLVNYLHDMLYEFSAHRILVEDLNDRNIEIYQDFTQFGGDVVIYYDCTVPIFNIRNIENKKGDKLLQIVTIGQLKDSNDQSFNNFKGLPENKMKKGRKSYKKAKSEIVSLDNQQVQLDLNWTKKMDNLWIMKNDDSILSLNTISLPPFNEENQIKNFLIRYFIKGSNSSYLIYDTLKITEKSDSLAIQAETYNSETAKTVVNNIILSKNKDTKLLNFFSLASYKQTWLNNQKYFENIIKSYKTN